MKGLKDFGVLALKSKAVQSEGNLASSKRDNIYKIEAAQ